jgi:hypothetical protein
MRVRGKVWEELTLRIDSFSPMVATFGAVARELCLWWLCELSLSPSGGANK